MQTILSFLQNMKNTIYSYVSQLTLKCLFLELFDLSLGLT